MPFHPPLLHPVLCAAKAALAVALALLIVLHCGNPAPELAALGVLSALHHSDASPLRTFVILAGSSALGGALAVLLAPLAAGVPLRAGLGTLLLIMLCRAFRLEQGVPLGSVVLVAACLAAGTENALFAGCARFADAALGVATALSVQILLPPHHNPRVIRQMLSSLRQSVMLEMLPAVLLSRYPDLSPLQQRLAQLSEELACFERQPGGSRPPRRREADFLHGCEQLVYRMSEELSALSHGDSGFVPSTRLRERLVLYGFRFPAAQTASGSDSCVMDYHLQRLLNACVCLDDLLVFAEHPASGDGR